MVISNSFKCGVCLGLLDDTVMCQSGHPFCKPCLIRSLHVRGACPTCRRSMTPGDMVDGRVVNDFLTEAPVRCTNGEMCSWKGNLARITAHDNVCAFKKVDCANDCGKEVERRDLQNHRAVCAKEPMTCGGCVAQVVRTQLRAHVDYLCPEGTVKCALQCGLEATRNDIVQHVLESCPNKLNECPVAGCGAVVKNMDEHNTKEAMKHNFLLRRTSIGEAGLPVGRLHIRQWVVADPTRSVRSPAFTTTGGQSWEALAIPPQRGLPTWGICLRLVSGKPIIARVRVKMSAGTQDQTMTSVVAMMPGEAKKWQLEQITNVNNIKIVLVIQY
ncbi:TRAF5 [Branchiostoma lanceolatum]|uniref:TRAF5 protein n=1 Tax=Branchiostoma lanceolatum TaxID=7740 RepID=A0A8S4MMG7_BRALA|nr:TRAF5 [Branchiostoma lanceolatum]